MSIYVESRIMCDKCDRIEPTGSILCLDGSDYKKEIHDELKDCFADWRIDLDGDVLCPKCK